LHDHTQRRCTHLTEKAEEDARDKEVADHGHDAHEDVRAYVTVGVPVVPAPARHTHAGDVSRIDSRASSFFQ
jgi:hypothetical protein